MEFSRHKYFTTMFRSNKIGKLKLLALSFCGIAASIFYESTEDLTEGFTFL